MIRRLWMVLSVAWTLLIWVGAGLIREGAPYYAEKGTEAGPWVKYAINLANSPEASDEYLGRAAKGWYPGAYDDLSDVEVGQLVRKKYGTEKEFNLNIFGVGLYPWVIGPALWYISRWVIIGHWR